jgi:hypothetical protein
MYQGLSRVYYPRSEAKTTSTVCCNVKKQINVGFLLCLFFSKRELLLNKIHDQATQIKDLMAQLESLQTADKKTAQLTASLHTELARSSTLGSPRSGSFAESGYLDATSTYDTSSISAADSGISQENQEWMTKARENLDAFGEFIRLGGSSADKKDLVVQDLEDSSSSDEGYHLARESSGSEGEADVDIDHPYAGRHTPIRERRLSRKSSPSDHKKMFGLPGQASPFGMMAALSVKKTRSKRPASTVSDTSDLGVANEDFFRSRGCQKPNLSSPS